MDDTHCWIIVKLGWTEQSKLGSRVFILVFEKVWQLLDGKTTHCADPTSPKPPAQRNRSKEVGN